MRQLLIWTGLCLTALCFAMCAVAPAYAQEISDEAAMSLPEVPTAEDPAPAEEPSDSGLASEAVTAYKAGKYLVALGVVLMLAVRLFRRGVWFIPALGEKLLRTSWFKTRAGGYTLVGVLAVLEFASLKLYSGAPFSWEMAMGIASAAWIAISQHEIIKDATAGA